jgi:AsmA protein
VGVELISLIFSKQVNVDSIAIDSPDVNLIHGPGGKWNYSSLGGSSSSTPANKTASDNGSSTPLTVKKLELRSGKIIVSTAGSSQKPSVYENVDLEASDLSYTSQFPFKLSAKGPGNTALTVEGKAGPINATDSSLTPHEARRHQRVKAA